MINNYLIIQHLKVIFSTLRLEQSNIFKTSIVFQIFYAKNEILTFLQRGTFMLMHMPKGHVMVFGGNLKQLSAEVSLQRSSENQILNDHDSWHTTISCFSAKW